MTVVARPYRAGRAAVIGLALALLVALAAACDSLGQEDPAGEVPQALLVSIRRDLADSLEIEPDRIEVVRAEQAIWSDGSLGCPQPGEMYAQATVDGYWIILRVDEIEYDYRASDNGLFLRCDDPLNRGVPIG